MNENEYSLKSLAVTCMVAGFCLMMGKILAIESARGAIKLTHDTIDTLKK